MDGGGGYVVAGYALTGGVLVFYAVWLAARLRRARRSVTVADAPDA